VTVNVRWVAEPIAGNVTADGQATRPFTGWLQMLAVLQEALESVRTEAGVRPGTD
jgi:hypothetical protein